MDDNVYTIDDEISDLGVNRPHVVILGAGASKGAFKEGDRNGKQLPVLNELLEVLDVEYLADEFDTNNFEEIYSKLFDLKDQERIDELNRKNVDYFYDLEIPESPTIYDYLLLSLRAKDLVATFNWDPLLLQAYKRNYCKLELPQIAFLHGNFQIGYCIEHLKKRPVNCVCSICKKPFTPTKLLYPIRNKDYNHNNFIRHEWNALKNKLQSAFLITIFGYSAPKSDVVAKDLMKGALGDINSRVMEEIEIIDIKKEDEIIESWNEFTYADHMQIHDDYFQSIISGSSPESVGKLER